MESSSYSFFHDSKVSHGTIGNKVAQKACFFVVCCIKHFFYDVKYFNFKSWMLRCQCSFPSLLTLHWEFEISLHKTPAWLECDVVAVGAHLSTFYIAKPCSSTNWTQLKSQAEGNDKTTINIQSHDNFMILILKKILNSNHSTIAYSIYFLVFFLKSALSFSGKFFSKSWCFKASSPRFKPLALQNCHGTT